MKVAYFDCPSGVAGDMILGALVDAGLPFETLRDRLAGLRLPGYTLERREVMKGAFRATKIEVHVAHAARLPEAHPHRDLPGSCASSPPPISPIPSNRPSLESSRGWARPRGVSTGSPPERVQFHDVGAVDAIVDVTGACIGLDWLGVDAVHCSALPIGGGMVRGPHGPMPVPAPGTAELLKGFPVVDTGVKRELVTPTGAAILTTLAAGAGAMPAMTVTTIGYGAGTMDLETPNVLRVFVGETTEQAGTGDHRPGGDDGRRHVAPALRAADGASVRGGRAGCLPHAGAHEEEPARSRGDRALRAGRSRAR